MNYDENDQALEIFGQGLLQRAGNSSDDFLSMLKMLFTLLATKDPTLTAFGRLLASIDPQILAKCGIDYQEIISGKGISFYQLHFEEKVKLGEGSFGSVHLVRHKLDGNFYAVKTVEFACRNLDSFKESRVFREATHLANIDSPHIVRYYSSWVEYQNLQISKSTKSLKDITEKDDDGVYIYDDTIPEVQALDCFDSFPEVQELDGFGFDNVEYESSRDWGFQEGQQVEDDELKRQTSFGLTRQTSFGSPIRAVQIVELTKTCKLFLQMEFGGAWTLHNYLDDARREPNKCDIVTILIAVLQGLVAVHSRNIVHRDLKPTNIFINVPQQTEAFLQRFQEENHPSQAFLPPSVVDPTNRVGVPVPMQVDDWIIKLGDFGLSKDLSGDFSVHQPNVWNADSISESQGVGTMFYAAPEQIDLEVTEPVTSKADMFSVGIILCELLLRPFVTQHERLEVIYGIREGNYPAFWNKFPYLSSLIPNFLERDPKRRISASEALDLVQYCCEDDFQDLMSESKQTLALEVMKLRKMLAQAREEQLHQAGEENTSQDRLVHLAVDKSSLKRLSVDKSCSLTEESSASSQEEDEAAFETSL